MTPRSVLGHNAVKDFARQVADHRQELDGQPARKKFKSSAAPKGTKLAPGYQDRTERRRTGDEGSADDKEKRLKALEEQFKLQQIDETTFEKLKEEIGVGGDLHSTHLVKGLDWKLLERVRRGEDVHKAATQERDSAGENAPVDVDEELDHVLDQDVHALAKRLSPEDAVDSEQPSKAPVITRDEILRRLKESRNAQQPPAVAPEPVLGDKFKKVSSVEKPRKQKFVETVNGRRREVLLITNEDGTTKRKTRWIDHENDAKAKGEGGGSARAEPKAQPLGMEIPAEFLAKQKALLEQQAAEEEDDDIFQGVGTDYNPLAGIESEENSDAEVPRQAPDREEKDSPAVNKPRNYFSTGSKDDEAAADKTNPITRDPTLLAALKRAAALRQDGASTNHTGAADLDEADPDRALRQQQILERLKANDRADAADMDLGFGESRFGDEDDEDGPIWDDDGAGGGKKSGRKRGPKKRKGDKNNVSDVMRVVEGRKEKT